VSVFEVGVDFQFYGYFFKSVSVFEKSLVIGVGFCMQLVHVLYLM